MNAVGSKAAVPLVFNACKYKLVRPVCGLRLWDSLRGFVGLREDICRQVRDKMLMYGRPRLAGEGEMNLMKYFAGWDADEMNSRK